MIRGATPNDLPQIVTLVTSLAAHHDDTACVTTTTLSRDLFGPHPWIHCFVAGQTDLQGYMALTQLARLQWGQRGLDIHHLFVAEPHRNQGIGRAFIAAAIDFAGAQNCDYLTVSALETNPKAAGFYRDIGFTPAGNSALRFALDLSARQGI